MLKLRNWRKLWKQMKTTIKFLKTSMRQNKNSINCVSNWMTIGIETMRSVTMRIMMKCMMLRCYAEKLKGDYTRRKLTKNGKTETLTRSWCWTKMKNWYNLRKIGRLWCYSKVICNWSRKFIWKMLNNHLSLLSMSGPRSDTFLQTSLDGTLSMKVITWEAPSNMETTRIILMHGQSILNHVIMMQSK